MVSRTKAKLSNTKLGTAKRSSSKQSNDNIPKSIFPGIINSEIKIDRYLKLLGELLGTQ